LINNTFAFVCCIVIPVANWAECIASIIQKEVSSFASLAHISCIIASASSALLRTLSAVSSIIYSFRECSSNADIQTFTSILPVLLKATTTSIVVRIPTSRTLVITCYT
jgi:hypothetical protein